MKKRWCLSKQESAFLRERLINGINNVFVSNHIVKYLSADADDTELLLLNGPGGDAPGSPQSKLAIYAWLSMYTADRHTVLAKFYCLYTHLPVKQHRRKKTLVFCALLIHEFAHTLADALAWPE